MKKDGTKKGEYNYEKREKQIHHEKRSASFK
jgi:hypothetical protein